MKMLKIIADPIKASGDFNENYWEFKNNFLNKYVVP